MRSESEFTFEKDGRIRGILTSVQPAHLLMTRQNVLDLYFMDARARLIDLAAFLDRLDRADGAADFRIDALRQAFTELASEAPGRAERVLLALSDPTTDPIPSAPGKGAVGAWKHSG